MNYKNFLALLIVFGLSMPLIDAKEPVQAKNVSVPLQQKDPHTALNENRIALHFKDIKTREIRRRRLGLLGRCMIYGGGAAAFSYAAFKAYTHQDVPSLSPDEVEIARQYIRAQQHAAIGQPKKEQGWISWAVSGFKKQTSSFLFLLGWQLLFTKSLEAIDPLLPSLRNYSNMLFGDRSVSWLVLNETQLQSAYQDLVQSAEDYADRIDSVSRADLDIHIKQALSLYVLNMERVIAIMMYVDDCVMRHTGPIDTTKVHERAVTKITAMKKQVEEVIVDVQALINSDHSKAPRAEIEHLKIVLEALVKKINEFGTLQYYYLDITPGETLSFTVVPHIHKVESMDLAPSDHMPTFASVIRASSYTELAQALQKYAEQHADISLSVQQRTEFVHMVDTFMLQIQKIVNFLSLYSEYEAGRELAHALEPSGFIRTVNQLRSTALDISTHTMGNEIRFNLFAKQLNEIMNEVNALSQFFVQVPR